MNPGGAPTLDPSRADALRAGLVVCVAHAREVDVAAFVSSTDDVVARELARRVVDVAQEALALCRRASELFDHPTEPDDERDDVADPYLEIADVAFIGATELRSMVDRLADLQRIGRDERMELCSRVLRRSIKTLGALDGALARASESTSTLGLGDDLVRSIETRRHYARIRRNVVAQPAPVDAPTARRALERARIHFSLLAASDVYPALRLTDRRQVDDLQARIHAALATDPTGSFVPDVARLWQDVLGFVRLVSAINRRQELVESDAAVISAAYQALATATSIPTKLRAQLDLLAGSHEDVDALLESGEWGVEPWRALVAELHERHVRPVTGRFRVVPNLASGRSLT